MEFSAIEISRMGRKEEKEEGLGVCGVCCPGWPHAVILGQFGFHLPRSLQEPPGACGMIGAAPAAPNPCLAHTVPVENSWH